MMKRKITEMSIETMNETIEDTIAAFLTTASVCSFVNTTLVSLGMACSPFQGGLYQRPTKETIGGHG